MADLQNRAARQTPIAASHRYGIFPHLKTSPIPSPTPTGDEATSIDLVSLDIDQLAELLAKVQTEMVSRERENRKELRAELEYKIYHSITILC